MIHKICEECHEVFEGNSTRPAQRFCSKRCQNGATHRRASERDAARRRDAELAAYFLDLLNRDPAFRARVDERRQKSEKRRGSRRMTEHQRYLRNFEAMLRRPEGIPVAMEIAHGIGVTLERLK